MTAAHQARHRGPDSSSPGPTAQMPQTAAPRVAPSEVLTRADAIDVQRLAGNRATAVMLRRMLDRRGGGASQVVQRRRIDQDVDKHFSRTWDVYGGRWTWRIEIIRAYLDYYRHFVDAELQRKKNVVGIGPLHEEYLKQRDLLEALGQEGGKSDAQHDERTKDLAQATEAALKALVSALNACEAVISAPTKTGTSAHPTISRGGANNAEAVAEAQQKMSTAPQGPKDLKADGIFGPLTEAAVKAFQKRNTIAETGVVDAGTWDLLDAQGKSSVGRVERKWEQTLLGVKYGMTSKYSWEIDKNKILVSVGINFVADPTYPPADLGAVTTKWKARILGRWNQFKAVSARGESRDIVFAIPATGGNTVNVIDADVGSDAGNWSVPDNEHDNGPSHEFGHMIGLEDEYTQSLAGFQRLHPERTQKEEDQAKGAFYTNKPNQWTNETSMMGMGALSAHDDAGADPEPRHVREFAQIVENFLGGNWEAQKK